MKRAGTWMVKGWLAAFVLFVNVMFAAAPMVSAAAEQPNPVGPAVYVIRAEQTVESGLQSYLERAYAEAEEAQAERIVLVLNTFGGRVDSAEAIGELVRGSKVPTIAYVQGKAVSAGTYIALNAKELAMQPGSTIGAAAVVDGSGKLIDNPKTISYWTKTMMAAAELNGRNQNIAAAMVNTDVTVEMKEIGRTKEKGDILTLSAPEAVKVGYAEYTADSVEDLLKQAGLSERTVIEVGQTAMEQIAEFLTSPVMKTLLLIIGIAGVTIELIIPGFGLPGIIGVVGFGLYFFGHYIAGFAGMEDVVLFVLGIALLVSELFVPSFGILGILGTVSLIAGIVMASPNAESALLSLFVALVAAAVIVFFIARRFKHRGVWNKFILKDRMTTEEGYVSSSNKTTLLGKVGETLTPLRPAGTARIGDERIDVVTNGEFIAAGTQVEVVKVEGTRVVVRQC
ncbi:NfeD family protein [Paenibacillus spongiae]|uniref:ATP-dependent Clp protease proteolytic subunit n=1 Tax=Paenibacillus spongiae TaxID=2909671 RepID=A0ABY5SF75_9BACL|nr:NfeD family protein [Paenibacillus spongiae]UVI32135.1 ATP-dependent Clp protease proteolytic subunit [Paenibacillus spongiae]